MKSDRILDAIGLIDEQAVLDARGYQRPRSRHWVRLCAVAAAALLLSGTAMAAWTFLRPAQVPEQFNDHDLSAAFDSEDAIEIDASATSGGYTFTLMALVSGEGLSDYLTTGALVEPERTYAVLAIQNADGTPLDWDTYDTMGFLVTPFIRGEKPWQVNVFSLGGNAGDAVVGGVAYRLVEFNDVMPFAGRGVYLGVCDSPFITAKGAFRFDEDTGEISADPDYPGASVVFELPLDPSSADPERAQATLDRIYEHLGLNGEGGTAGVVPDTPQETEAIELPPEVQEAVDRTRELMESTDWDSLVPVEGSYQEIAVDEDGYLVYSYPVINDSTGVYSVGFNRLAELIFGRFDAGETEICLKHASVGGTVPIYALRITKIDDHTVGVVVVLPE